MKRATVAVLGVVIAGVAVWGLVTYGPYARWYLRVRWRAITASRREPAALEAWRSEFGDAAATVAALQAHEDNTTAVRLLELGPGAGVNWRGAGEYSATFSAITNYVTAESMKTGGPVGPPPEAVRSYLDAHRLGLEAVVDLLARAEPWWKTQEWPEGSSAPRFALTTLDDLLLAEALAHSSAGRDADAERALVASWHLNTSFRDDPSIVGQALVERTTSREAGIARRLTLDAMAWRARLREHDYNASMMRALVVWASPKFSTGTSQMARAARADFLDLMRADLLELRDRPVTGWSLDEVDPDRAMRDGWSAGATVAMIARSGDERAWISADLAMLQLELTDRVLQARQLKARQGRWPATIPNIETSRIAGVHWIYRLGPDRQMSIAVSPALQGSGPPLRFESHE